MKKSEWHLLEYVFGKPWLASILIGSSIHLFFYMEEQLILNLSYFSGLIEDWAKAPPHAAGRFLIPFLIPFIVTSISRRMVARREQRSLFRFPRANPEIVMKLDETGRVIYMNPTAGEYLSLLGLDSDDAYRMLPDGYPDEIKNLFEAGEVFTAIKNTGDIVLRYVFRAFDDEKTILVSGCDITEQISMTEFINDAVPLMYRAKRDGTILFIGGAFKRLLQTSDFGSIRDALYHFGVEKEETDAFHEKLTVSGRDDSTTFRNTRNIELNINGSIRWHVWGGAIAFDGESIQGQLFDIHDQYLKELEFDKLREMTYGTACLGERIAMGLEEARDRDLSIMFIDIVDSTMRISSMSPDEAKEYVEAFSKIVTAVVPKYSGYVDKFMGDGAMVVFGLQTLAESEVVQHPQHSVNAAREIISEFRKHNTNTSEDKHLHVRIGIASGVVRSGVFRNDERMIFTSIGIPVITAARLEVKADKDSILITHAHHKRLYDQDTHHIKCGSHRLKGLSQEITACTII